MLFVLANCITEIWFRFRYQNSPPASRIRHHQCPPSAPRRPRPSPAQRQRLTRGGEGAGVPAGDSTEPSGGSAFKGVWCSPAPASRSPVSPLHTEVGGVGGAEPEGRRVGGEGCPRCACFSRT
eukprot:3932778-Rhodomonas_salina.1